ncbi:unnamed protein product [Angiostrongylus costaricensis]|uniref:Col_cuticle_N domain-containing protein n=1 Tax=Angiostrongylus costaricensis TaxID=334426 RepID=A0A0R3PCL9_ANGCS|nr:unnamed protein product [Angiostrongylus costaricensis]
MELQTPMLNMGDSTQNSSVVARTAADGQEKKIPESSAVRTNRSLRRLHLLLLVLVVMVLITVLLSAVIAIKLGHMEQQMDHAQERLSENIQEAINVGVLQFHCFNV